MTRDAWRKIIGGYAILALAWFIGLGVSTLQQRHIDANSQRITTAVHDFCEIIRQPNPPAALDSFIKGNPIPVDRQCATIVRRLNAVK